jgi:hypothetical protein
METTMHNQKVISGNRKTGSQTKKLNRITTFCGWLTIGLVFLLGELFVAIASQWTDVTEWIPVLGTSCLLIFVVLASILGMLSRD